MRRLPHQGARHGTVDHGDASDGLFFLRVERSSFEDLSPLSVACGWPLGANGSLYCEWRHLHGLRVENPSDGRKGGLNLRTMCGSRTGGWSLPYVMSD
jgi:hypothetical protein